MDPANKAAAVSNFVETTPPLISNARRWSIVGLQFFASLVNYVHRVTLPVALPVIAAELALGPEKKGVLLSAFFWSYCLMQVPIGWCSDRYNLRWLYAGMFALWSVACGLTGLAGSLVALIAARALLGIGESVYLPGGTKIVSILFAPKDAGLPLGLFNSGTRWGLTLGTPLIAWLIDRYGWRNMFFLVGFAALIWLIPWLLAFPSRLEHGTANAVAPGVAAVPERPRAVTFNRNLLGICLGFFCYDYFWYMLFNWLPDYLVQVRKLTVFQAGIYAMLPFLVFAIGMPLGGWIADLLIHRGWDETRTRKGLITLTFLPGLLLIPAEMVADPTAAIWLVAGASLVGLSTANVLALVQCCAPPDEVGVWTGFENFAGNLAGVIMPIVTGYLIAWTGSYLPGFALAAFVLLVGLFSYWFVVGELKPSAKQP